MTRETRIGLLVGLAFIVAFGIILTELAGITSDSSEQGAARPTATEWLSAKTSRSRDAAPGTRGCSACWALVPFPGTPRQGRTTLPSGARTPTASPAPSCCPHAGSPRGDPRESPSLRADLVVTS